MLNEVGSVYIPNDFLETNQLGYELAKQGAYFAANVMNNEIDVFAGDMAWLLDAAANISSLLAAKIVNQNFLQSTVEKIDAIKKMSSDQRKSISISEWSDAFTNQPHLPQELFLQLPAEALADMQNALWSHPEFFKYLNAEQSAVFLQSTHMLRGWGDEAQWENFDTDSLAKAIVNIANDSPYVLTSMTSEQWEDIFSHQPALPKKLLFDSNALSATQQEVLLQMVWPALRAIGIVGSDEMARAINKIGFFSGFLRGFTDSELAVVLTLMKPQYMREIATARWLELFKKKPFLLTPELLLRMPESILDNPQIAPYTLKIPSIPADTLLPLSDFFCFVSNGFRELPDDYKVPLLQGMLKALDPTTLNNNKNLEEFVGKSLFEILTLKGLEQEEAFFSVAHILDENKIKLSHSALKLLINNIAQFDLPNRGIVFESIVKFLIHHPDRETSRSVFTEYRKNTELMLEKIQYLACEVRLAAFQMLHALAIPHFIDGKGDDSLGYNRDWKGLYLKLFNTIKHICMEDEAQAWDDFRKSAFYKHGFVEPGSEASQIIELGKALRLQVESNFLSEKTKSLVRNHLNDYIDHAREVYWGGFFIAVGNGMTDAAIRSRRFAYRPSVYYQPHFSELKFKNNLPGNRFSSRDRFKLNGHSITVNSAVSKQKIAWVPPKNGEYAKYSDGPIYTKKYFYVVKNENLIKTGTGFVNNSSNKRQEPAVLRLRGDAPDETKIGTKDNKRKNTHIRFDSDVEDTVDNNVIPAPKRLRTGLQEKRPLRTRSQKYKPTEKERAAGIESEGDSDSEDINYAYRALRPNEIPSNLNELFSTGLHAKNIRSNVTVTGHIATGSKTSAGSSFISGTASRKIAGAYAAETAASANIVPTQKNTPDYGYIVKFRLRNRVQANRLNPNVPLEPGQSVDFTDKKILDAYFPGNPRSKAFAVASQEVIVKEHISGSDIVSISKVRKINNLESYFRIREEGTFGGKKVDAAFQGRAQRTYKNERQAPFAVIVYDKIDNPNISPS